jgi:hypothetical protein
MTSVDNIQELANNVYKYGFETSIEADTVPPGLSEEVITHISRKKGEPQFMLDWRLKAYRHWLTMCEPHWAKLKIAPVDYQAISYYSAPKTEATKSLDEVDPTLLATYEKLGVPLQERALLAGVAVDAVFDSVSVATTFREKLSELGILFCRPLHRQLLRRAQLGRLHRRLVLLRPQGRALSDGAFDLFPDQRQEHGPVRADAAHRRRGGDGELPRRVHGADA